MAIFGHAADRVDSRVKKSIGDKIAANIARAANNAAKQATRDTAVILYKIGYTVHAGQSTGDTIVAVIRNRRVTTIMLRESYRNNTQGLRVEEVWDWS